MCLVIVVCFECLCVVGCVSGCVFALCMCLVFLLCGVVCLVPRVCVWYECLSWVC